MNHHDSGGIPHVRTAGFTHIGIHRAWDRVGGAGRRVAENADGAAFSDVVSAYAALGRVELREAARAVVSATSGRG